MPQMASAARVMGSGRGAVDSIAQQHLDVSRRQLAVSEKQLAAIQKIPDAFEKMEGSIEVPGS